MNQYTTYWLKHFREHELFGHLRFKRLIGGYTGYPPFDIDERLVDKVELKDFLKIEKDRIPIFVGGGFVGMNPWMDKIPGFYDEERLICTLSKSVLSGCVFGFTIYKIVEKEMVPVIRFENVK